MLSHVTVGSPDLRRARSFYDPVLATLGLACHFAQADGLGYGPLDPKRLESGASALQFWVLPPFDGRPAHPGNGWHVAFLAPSRDAVDAFHRAALAAGGRDEGAPGLRPHYHAGYYAAYVRDLDGNKLQAVHNTRSPGDAGVL